MVGTVSFTTLLICRVIPGEGPAGAVAVHAIYKWFPDEKRALPTAVLSRGSAGILAPSVMGGVIQRATGMLDGYMTGFTINAVILIVSGSLGLLLAALARYRARTLDGRSPATEIRLTIPELTISALVECPGSGAGIDRFCIRDR
jgi:MFS family permease